MDTEITTRICGKCRHAWHDGRCESLTRAQTQCRCRAAEDVDARAIRIGLMAPGEVQR